MWLKAYGLLLRLRTADLKQRAPGSLLPDLIGGLVYCSQRNLKHIGEVDIVKSHDGYIIRN